MKETILLFQFDKEKQKRLMRCLMPLKLRVKQVEEKDFGQPIGYLAGIKEIVPLDTDASPKVLDGEMLVMAGLSGQRVDMVLSAIRKSGVGPVPYKAVLTPTNQSWDAAALLAELKREHEKMKGDG